jgi:hypothetical protein
MARKQDKKRVLKFEKPFALNQQAHAESTKGKLGYNRKREKQMLRKEAC